MSANKYMYYAWCIVCYVVHVHVRMWCTCTYVVHVSVMLWCMIYVGNIYTFSICIWSCMYMYMYVNMYTYVRSFCVRVCGVHCMCVFVYAEGPFWQS